MENLFFAMALFAVVGAVTPGPVNFLATQISLTQGRLAALFHVMSASIAYALVVFLSGYGLSTVSQLHPLVEMLMRVLASGLLIWIAVQLLFSKGGSSSGAFEATKWWSGALLQLCNPKAWLVASAGVSLFVVNQPNPNIALSYFTLISLVACAIGVGSWALLGQILNALLDSANKQRTFNLSMAGLLMLSVLLIWIE